MHFTYKFEAETPGDRALCITLRQLTRRLETWWQIPSVTPPNIKVE